MKICNTTNNKKARGQLARAQCIFYNQSAIASIPNSQIFAVLVA